MQILVVEGNPLKRQYVEYFLDARNIDRHLSFSVNSAIKYVQENLNEISGIILDLGLTSYDESTDYDSMRGLEFIEELTKKGIYIPILINSSVTINLPNIMQHHSNVKGQTFIVGDYEKLEWFITTLNEEKQ